MRVFVASLLIRAVNARLTALRPLSSSTKTAATGYLSNLEFERDVDALCDFISSANSLVAITGAGISTGSGIPDYRGENGSYKFGHKPQTHQEFTSSERSRRRYWVRSLIGYQAFSRAQPNPAHTALSRLEHSQHLKGVITQNVDRLHSKAGSVNVVDLHGRSDRVQCLDCGLTLNRRSFHQSLEDANIQFMARVRATLGANAANPAILRADADAEVNAFEDEGSNGNGNGDGDGKSAGFCVLPCPRCGSGCMKPTVVFFGDNVNPSDRTKADALIAAADALLIVGTSLEVFSVYRYIKPSAERGVAMAVLNKGPTRLDRDIQKTIIGARPLNINIQTAHEQTTAAAAAAAGMAQGARPVPLSLQSSLVLRSEWDVSPLLEAACARLGV